LIKDLAEELYFLHHWDTATIEEELRTRMKFMQVTKLYAYSFGGGTFETIGIGPVL